MDKKAKIRLISMTAILAVLITAFYLMVQMPEFKIDSMYDGIIKVEVKSDFEDLGADAYLGKHKVIPKMYSLTEVNTERIGEYQLTYEANFLWRKDRKIVKVIVEDTQAPRIELMHNGTMTQPGKEYIEEGYIAYDNYDGDITHLVERKIEGKKIYYSVKDSSGNEAEAQRVINYNDKEAPKINLSGEKELVVYIGDNFSDPGVTAIDNVDGDVTRKVVSQNNVDTQKEGTYLIKYTVKDSTGNEATAQRKVIVKVKTSQPVQQIPPNGKVIYLTFDDGPSEHTPRLLNILRKYNVKATFFVVGSGNLNYLDDIVNSGHSIGLHTMTHNYAKIYSGERAFMDEIETLRRIVYNRTGVDTTMIRFPGGSSNTISRHYNIGIMSRLVKRITAEGYQYYDWNVTSGDAGEVHSSWQVYNNVISGVQRQKISIVLQHDTKGFSVDAVDDIIKWGLSNGYSFRKLTPGGPTVHHGVNN